MPVRKLWKTLRVAQGIKVFLRLEVGGTRGEVPDADLRVKARAKRQRRTIGQQKQKIERQRRTTGQQKQEIEQQKQKVEQQKRTIERQKRTIEKRDRQRERILEQLRGKLSEKDLATVLWEAGKENEVEWWRKWFDSEGQLWRPEEYNGSLNPEQPLLAYITERLDAPPGATVSILDVGSGPLTKIGQRWAERTVHIVAVDPLADEYNRLLGDYGITPPVQAQPGEVERLTELFPRNHFDLVHMQNALDHSYDPLLGIRNLLELVKPGGCVVLLHFVNEGERSNYEGLHQWNFCAEDGHFVIWNRSERFSINDAFGDIAEVTVNTIEATEEEKTQVKGEVLVTLRKMRDARESRSDNPASEMYPG